MKLYEYAKLDALGLAELVRTGAVNPRELAATALEAIEAVNPELNAVVEVYRDRIDDLKDDSLAAGPVPGMPFLMKDTGAFLAGRKTERGRRGCRGGRSHCARIRHRRLDTDSRRVVRRCGVEAIERSRIDGPCAGGGGAAL